MLKTLRIAIFLLLLINLVFFYGIIRRWDFNPYMFFVSEGELFNKFTSILLINKGFNSIHGWSNNTEGSSTKASSIQENILLETMTTPSSTLENTALRSPSDVLKEGDGIIFLETSDRTQLTSLILCAIESTARVYKNRPVAFFMKGLNNTNIEEMMTSEFPVLSSLRNIYFFPLNLTEVFTDTPLLSWYQKINPQQEKHWIYVSSDACRLALIWKYGGIYVDTDFISMQSIPDQDFLAAEFPQFSSNGIFGFSPHHNFTQKCMEDFVQNYNGNIWGYQGPLLFTRVLKKFCHLPKFNGTEDIMCGNITFFNPKRFYPITYPVWRKFYQVWDELPTFNDSYALHLWNFMNHANLTIVPGSNVLAEHLYKKYCPSAYGTILRNATT
ncbi:alpha-1,4-N-acetylglucosaminyltransferase-like [Eleutherodactylus coqui]|uniref:alpha-1,4-N-acetylglucosaminyltransferase-like n=1 Tax=Eleutherodactylus coqui TaxID=57060 RepID=UPI003462AABF